MLEYFKKSDRYLYLKLNQSATHQSIKWLMMVTTQLGSTPFALGLCVWAAATKHWGLVGTVVLTQAAVQSVKRLVKRTRPYLVCKEAVPILPPKCQNSFPSGHTATAFAIAFAFVQYYPPLGGLFITLAAGVACSRMILGVHYPSDVFVGIAIAYGAFAAVVAMGL